MPSDINLNPTCSHKERALRVKFILGLIYSKKANFAKAIEMFECRFGPIDTRGALTDFNHTHYYEEEFGPDLKRIFFSFKKLIAIENIYRLKLYSQKIERRLSYKNRRTVNLDPGYIVLDKLILFTTKNYSHRIYLNKGIYAEVTLQFKKDSFLPMPWTYPDYKMSEYIDYFNKVRQIYRGQLKGRDMA